MITSIQNPKVKLIRELLGHPRERRTAGAFVAEGVRLVEEALRADWPFQFVLAAAQPGERGSALVNALQAHGVQVETADSRILRSISGTETTQGILAVLEHKELPLPARFTCGLIPDQVRDPGNLGTLLRTAAAAGVEAVLLPPETADAFSPKVVRAGMGAHFHLPILTLGWDEIEKLAGQHDMFCILADMDGTPCWEMDLRQPILLVIGGEANGAGARAQALAQEKISLPMPGGSESLNAGVAGSILMFEILRQRTKAG